MIWVVGAGGLAGAELSRLLAADGLDRAASGRERDILDLEGLRAFARDLRPDWIVNCAAYTDVDQAETEREACEGLNVEGARNLAEAAKEAGAGFIQLSTDYVFPGDVPRPLREEDPIAPLSHYGATKAGGEAAALAAWERTIVLRTAWLYGQGKRNFVFAMLEAMGRKAAVSVVDDQVGSPTWSRDLARAILAIVRAPRHRYGIFHFAGSGSTSRFDFAREIGKGALERGLLEGGFALTPIGSAERRAPARRPAFSALSSEKLGLVYGFHARAWRAGLADFLDEVAADRRSGGGLGPEGLGPGGLGLGGRG